VPTALAAAAGAVLPTAALGRRSAAALAPARDAPAAALPLPTLPLLVTSVPLLVRALLVLVLPVRLPAVRPALV
jgi:hypothetical protein